MRTIVYIDGFNLYYGALKGTPYRWLNPLALVKHLLQEKHEVIRVRYFTARLRATPEDETLPLRQEVYLRALLTVPEIRIYYGHFLRQNVWMRLADPQPGAARKVKVVKNEEKGSDVNIAVHMLDDAHRDRCDAAVLISNDSDLAEAVQMVREGLKKTVGVLNPHKRSAKTLRERATFVKPIRKKVLELSQFPPELEDAHGRLHKPRGW